MLWVEEVGVLELFGLAISGTVQGCVEGGWRLVEGELVEGDIEVYRLVGRV